MTRIVVLIGCGRLRGRFDRGDGLFSPRPRWVWGRGCDQMDMLWDWGTMAWGICKYEACWEREMVGEIKGMHMM